MSSAPRKPIAAKSYRYAKEDAPLNDIVKFTAREIAARVNAGELSPPEIARAFRERIAAYDGDVGAFLQVAASDPAEKARGPLAGVPVAVKDNICTRAFPTTAGSKILAPYRPPYNATVVAKLIQAGAFVIGKTNLDEFAMGSSTEYSAFHITRNPRDLTRSPGGSSGGSAAAVAAGFAPLALGSDTGGSIRQPAAMCGVVGMKGTYGLVSRYGLIAFAPSFDQIGPLARNVGDAALLLSVIAGHDPLEATSSRDPVPPYLAAIESAGPRRIGLIKEFSGAGVGEDIRAAINKALAAAAAAGHAVNEISLPSADWALPTYFVTGCSETYSNLTRYQGVLFGAREPGASPAEMTARTRGLNFGAEVRRRMVAGAYALSVGYRDRYAAKAQAARAHMKKEFGAAFEEYDFLVSPISPFTAFPLNTRNLDPQLMYLADIFTSVANLVGIPALSLPCGYDTQGLPIGLQIMGRPKEEANLLAFACQLEEALALPLEPIKPY